MKKFSLYLPEQQINSLCVLSETSGLSVSEHIRRAIDCYLNTAEHAGIYARGDDKFQPEGSSYHGSEKVAFKPTIVSEG